MSQTRMRPEWWCLHVALLQKLHADPKQETTAALGSSLSSWILADQLQKPKYSRGAAADRDCLKSSLQSGTTVPKMPSHPNTVIQNPKNISQYCWSRLLMCGPICQYDVPLSPSFDFLRRQRPCCEELCPGTDCPGPGNPHSASWASLQTSSPNDCVNFWGWQTPSQIATLALLNIR